MTLPTAAEFKARHARFAAVDDGTVDLYLAEAGRTVDADLWAVDDYADGVMYLAAHLMLEEGALDPTGAAPGTSGRIKRTKAGEVEVEFQAQASGGSGRYDALYGGSIYGRRYLELAARNGYGGPTVLVV